MLKRRDFLRNSLRTGPVLAAVVPSAFAGTPSRPSARATAAPREALLPLADPAAVTTLRDPRVKALAHAALDAARAAGAHYADVRITQTLRRSVGSTGEPGQYVTLGLSVRALVDGYWGWTATPVLSSDEAARVARRSTAFAQQSATRVRGSDVELDHQPVITDGDWMTPFKIDPFDLELTTLQDWMAGLMRHVEDVRIARRAPASLAWTPSTDRQGPSLSATFEKQERLFASTEGTLVTQTVILTTPNLSFSYGYDSYGNSRTLLPVPTFNTPIQAGWERIAELPIVTLLERAMDAADAAPPPPPVKPLEIGRYDVVFSAQAMAQLLDATFGQATRLNNALGYEAYAGGTSYLGPDPLSFLGTAVASPLVTITAERSNPIGVATVKWDEEGVVPRDFPLVRHGVLENYQTTRAQAEWLARWYQQRGEPVQSLGCAMAPTALEEPLQHIPNLVLQPGPSTATEVSLVEELEHGLHITTIPPSIPPDSTGPNRAATLGMDWQAVQGVLTPVLATVIRQGKPVSMTPTANPMAIVFNTTELWKHVQALGGASSLEYAGGFTSSVGDPVQMTPHSIGAVPARIVQLPVVDTARYTP